MPDTKTPTGLTSQYTAQVVADLERNAKEQERIGAEMEELQEQLNALRHDHAVLTNLHQALGATSAPVETGPEPTAAPAVPRQKTAAKSAGGRRARTRKADTKKADTKKADTAKSTAARTSAAKKPAAKATSDQPTLIELIRRYLTEQREPRSAAEVSTALGQTHPDRRIQTNVVRTSLENLVAKSHVHRAKQGSSVFYTAVDAEEASVPSPGAEQPVKAEAGTSGD
ncbi:hypothetical protein CW362_02155 [Streptomyces populi]|uniref:Regulatory protein n=1 Tax=Streptomyces populi TaxID=2058924 RepID=A0A2I0SXW7_9ACTN|nr:hypothetical protein [Streptomyces populi]PKT74787.1 hypothetical protein CW362_02155 [Streptomyces populi]